MAQREYKQLGCRDLGADCNFLVRSDKEDEVISSLAGMLVGSMAGVKLPPNSRIRCGSQ